MDEFCYPVQQTADGKMFSPLHSQMQSELGDPFFYNNFNGEINDQQTFPFQYGTNAADDIENFLSCAIIEPEEQRQAGIYNEDQYLNLNILMKNSNSCSESEGEVSQKQVRHFFCCFSFHSINIILELEI